MMKLLDGAVIVESTAITKKLPEPKPNRVFGEGEIEAFLKEAAEDVAFLDWEKPQWREGGNVHNWHNYAPSSLQIIWESLTDTQKQAVAQALDRCASNEHWD